jgi:hypothetical protein
MRQYSAARGRFLITVNARLSRRRANGHYLVRPFAVLAARALGPGPLRLRLVRLAHDLGDGGTNAGADLPLDGTTVQPSGRAA